MVDESDASTIVRSATDCAVCRRSVLVGEPLTPFHDPRGDRHVAVCELCRDRARSRGWAHAGESVRRRGSTRVRVEHVGGNDGPATTLALAPAPARDLIERLRRQDVELERLRRDMNPARRAEEQRVAERQQAQLRELRGELQARDRRIEQLQRARHDETSPMRMSGHALDAFNQSRDLERMARIARTLGEPVINVHDEGPGIPRRVRLTLSWDIAWYEFTVKLDIGAGRASVHETGTGGEPSVLPLERRRANACWSGSGLKLS